MTPNKDEPHLTGKELDRRMNGIREEWRKGLLATQNAKMYVTDGFTAFEVEITSGEVESGFPDTPPRVKVEGFLRNADPASIPIPRRPLPLCDRRLPGFKDVIFNPPATIVLWSDGTKTVVKCGKNDTYSKEHGLAMCIAKKALGNKGNYNKVFKKWLQEKNE